MATLKHRTSTPPGGFWFIQRETRCRIEGDNLPELVKNVKDHRIYKKLGPLDPKEIQLEVERQICSRLGKDECYSEGGADEWRPVNIHAAILSPKTILAASKAAIEWLHSGKPHVPIETALKRKETCLGCPLNTPLTGCKCGTVYKALNAALPKEKKFHELGVCAACSCSLQLKVWLPRNVIEASNSEQDFPFIKECWQRDPNG